LLSIILMNAMLARCWHAYICDDGYFLISIGSAIGMPTIRFKAYSSHSPLIFLCNGQKPTD